MPFDLPAAPLLAQRCVHRVVILLEACGKGVEIRHLTVHTVREPRRELGSTTEANDLLQLLRKRVHPCNMGILQDVAEELTIRWGQSFHGTKQQPNHRAWGTEAYWCCRWWFHHGLLELERLQLLPIAGWRTRRWDGPLLVRPARDLAWPIRVPLGFDFAPQLVAVVAAVTPPLQQVGQVRIKITRGGRAECTLGKVLGVRKHAHRGSTEAKQPGDMTL